MLKWLIYAKHWKVAGHTCLQQQLKEYKGGFGEISPSKGIVKKFSQLSSLS